MSTTLLEVQTRLANATFKRQILHHLVEYIDENFQPQAGEEAKQKLLDEKRLPVPVEAFESVIKDILLKNSEELSTEIQNLLQANLQLPPPQPPAPANGQPQPAPQAQPAPAPVPAPVQAPAPAPVPAPVQPQAMPEFDPRLREEPSSPKKRGKSASSTAAQ